MARSHLKKSEWGKIKNAYVVGIERNGEIHWPTLEQIAEMFGVPQRTVKGHSLREGWVRERERRQNEYALEVRNRRQQKAAKAHEQFQDAARAMLINLVGEAIRHVRAIEELRKKDPKALMDPKLMGLLGRLLVVLQKIEHFLTPPVQVVEREVPAKSEEDPLVQAHIERIKALSDEQYIQAIDKFLGPPPFSASTEIKGATP